MSLHPAIRLGNARWQSGKVVLLLALSISAGCATLPCRRESPNCRSLRPVPQVPKGHRRADCALIAAFFAANGITLSPAEAEQIIPPAAPAGRIDRNAIRRAATKHNRLLLAVKADGRFLWEALGNRLPLLVLLPSDIRYHPAALPLIPVAWDREKGTLQLLDGNGEIQTISETVFFARRSPLKHAALCLIKPGALGHFEPTREQKLLLADFWFDKGFYRRADAAYTELQDEALLDTVDIDALVGRGNVLFREGRYEKAIPVFRAALALEPDNPKILNNLAYAMLHGGGELLAALRYAARANELDPGNPLILETIGSIQLRLGDTAAATKYLEQAWSHATQHPPEVQIAIMDQLIRAWYAADRQDLAWQVVEARRRNFPRQKFPNDIINIFPSIRYTSPPVGK